MTGQLRLPIGDGKRSRQHGTPVERAMRHIEVDENGCWIWTGSRTSSGYGHINLGRGVGYAVSHRLLYEHARGPIPAGLELDHLCRVRECVNPDHLEAVTHAENVLRGTAPSALLHRTGKCKNGHDREHSYLRPGTNDVVHCRVCRNARRRKAA